VIARWRVRSWLWAPVAALLVSRASSAAAAGPSKAASGIADRIETELDAWDIECAQRGLDDLVSKDGRSATAAYYRGRVLFEQGKYVESAAAYEEAEALADRIGVLDRGGVLAEIIDADHAAAVPQFGDGLQCVDDSLTRNEAVNHIPGDRKALSGAPQPVRPTGRQNGRARDAVEDPHRQPSMCG